MPYALMENIKVLFEFVPIVFTEYMTPPYSRAWKHILNRKKSNEYE